MKTINILGARHEIERLPDGSLEMRGNAGTAFNLLHRIVISTDQSNEEAISTFIHEILECIVYRLNINLGDGPAEKEHTIRLLEAGLYQVVVENFPRFKEELESLL